MTIPLITLVLYSAGLVGLGLWASAKARSADDFLLGGRNLGPWVAGLAYAASSSSAWVLLGFSGFVYAVGPSAIWMVPGILGGLCRCLAVGRPEVCRRARANVGT